MNIQFLYKFFSEALLVPQLKEYFDIKDEEWAYVSAYNSQGQGSGCPTAPTKQKEKADDVTRVVLAVDPDLERCFNCLKLIDEFRYTKDNQLVDKILF